MLTPLLDIRALYCSQYCKDVFALHSFTCSDTDLLMHASTHQTQHSGHRVRVERAGDPIGGRARQVCVEAIYAALTSCGEVVGRNHVGGGWSDWGPSEYEPPIPGLLCKWRVVHEFSEDGGKTWAQHVSGADARATVRQVHVLTVKHAGKGRKEALPRYVEHLRDYGFQADLRLLDPLLDRQPLIVVEAVDLERYQAKARGSG